MLMKVYSGGSKTEVGYLQISKLVSSRVST